MGVHAAENQVPFETGALENMEPGSIVNNVNYLSVSLCVQTLHVPKESLLVCAVQSSKMRNGS